MVYPRFVMVARSRRKRRSSGLWRNSRAAAVWTGLEGLETRVLMSCEGLVKSEIASALEQDATALTSTLKPEEAAIYLPEGWSDVQYNGTLDLEPMLAQSGPLINLDDFRIAPQFSGINGSGYSVAVLDTGIDLNHSYFGPDSDSNGVADRIVYDFDFADNDDDASDVNGHGSNVASIAASSNGTNTGMAPGANIIALKVFRNTGDGNFGYVKSALEWVRDNAVTYNIASVNMSLGDGGNYSSPISLYDIGPVLADLAALNVIVASASGNNFYSAGSVQGVTYPSANPNSLSIGAVYDANVGAVNYSGGTKAFSSVPDQIAPFSQRHETLTTIFAPGAPVTGANFNGGTLTLHGTSQATPMVAGVAVLAQQLAGQVLGRRLTPLEFGQMLRDTGVTINDGDNEDDNVVNTGLNFQRMDVLALGNAIVAMAQPAITSLSDSPDPVATGGTISLTAEGVSYPENVSDVAFYRESNGQPGLQTASDTLLGNDSDGSDGWSIQIGTGNLPAATYTYYAVAHDAFGTTSNVVSTTNTITNQAPTITSLTDSPDPLASGGTITLTANGVSDPENMVNQVAFYRESNGQAGLQIGSDTLLTNDANGADGWSILFATGNLPAGTYTYYAAASDNLGASSNIVSTTNTISSPGAVLPYSEDFEDGTANAINPVLGTWQVTGGRYQASATSTTDAVALLQLVNPQPSKVNLSATLRGLSNLSNVNGVLIFDYQNADNFKFAGPFFGAKSWKLGRVVNGSWLFDAVVADNSLSAGVDVQAQVVIDGTAVTLVGNGVTQISFNFGESLTDGQIGLGTRRAVTQFDNFIVTEPPVVLPVSENFDDGSADYMQVLAGTWQVNNGRYNASPINGGNAITVLTLNQSLPSSFRVSATINGEPPTGTLNSNGYLIFDFQDVDNFKFAGVAYGMGRWRIGHVTNGTWTFDSEVAATVSPGLDYQVAVEIQDTQAALLVDGQVKTTFNFGAALLDGQVGLATRKAVTHFDNFEVVQLAPSGATLPYSEDFDDATADNFQVTSGTWQLTNARYRGSAPANGYALSVLNVQGGLPLGVHVTTTVNGSAGSAANAFVIFDYQSPTDFKWAGTFFGTSRWRIGQYSGGNWTSLTVTSESLSTGVDYTIDVVVMDGTVTLSYGGQVKVTYNFGATNLTDGRIGLGTRNATSIFDNFNAAAAAAPTALTASQPTIPARLMDVLAKTWQTEYAPQLKPATSPPLIGIANVVSDQLEQIKSLSFSKKWTGRKEPSRMWVPDLAAGMIPEETVV